MKKTLAIASMCIAIAACNEQPQKLTNKDAITLAFPIIDEAHALRSYFYCASAYAMLDALKTPSKDFYAWAKIDPSLMFDGGSNGCKFVSASFLATDIKPVYAIPDHHRWEIWSADVEGEKQRRFIFTTGAMTCMLLGLAVEEPDDDGGYYRCPESKKKEPNQ